ncbi:heterokaryon incompatibility protein-domain-containing protein [Phyllosticta capitalensis]
MSSQYEYSSLATPSTIRLIQVKKQRVNGVIDCAIRHVDYAKQPDFKYYALSYVWGDSSPTRQLYLTDPAGEKLILPIHENLWRFLDWAWNRGWHDHWIWTDRICLNQQDKKEMAQQIPRMGKIFANAEQVLAWLGMSEQEGLNLKACLEGTIDPSYRLVRPILTNEYWSRVWIVQEVLVAKDVLVVVGDTEAHLWDLQSLFFIFLDEECGIRNLFEMRNERLLGPLEATSSSHYRCEREHDRVYGVLGLVDGDRDGTSPIACIEVDYNKPAVHALFDAVLESRPDHMRAPTASLLWRRYQETTGKLIMEAFLDYLQSEHTSERHKILAKYVIQVCDCLAAIPPLRCGMFTEWTISNLLRGLRCKGLVPDQPFQATLGESAVMIGITMTPHFANWKTSRFGRKLSYWGTDWQTCRESFSSKDPSWLCAVHQPSHSSKYEVKAESSLTVWCHTKHRFMACEKHSSRLPSCAESEMTCVLPEVGFRLTWWQPVSNDLDTQEDDDDPEEGLKGHEWGDLCIQFLHPDPTVQTREPSDL